MFYQEPLPFGDIDGRPPSPVHRRRESSTSPTPRAATLPRETKDRLPAVVRAALELVPPPARRTVGSAITEPLPVIPDKACADADPDLFFPDNARSEANYGAVRSEYCAACPLHAQIACMTWALKWEMDGLFGLTPLERIALGGAGLRNYPRPASSAAAAALRGGINPDALAAALTAVHGAAAADAPIAEQGIVGVA